MSKLTSAYLSQQCVISESGQRFEVRQGAGMGATGSAEVADTCFYNLAERRFALRRETKQDFGLLFYGRYRDDIFVVMDKPLAPFLTAFRNSCKEVYTLKLEKAELETVPLLDVLVYRRLGESL